MQNKAEKKHANFFLFVSFMLLCVYAILNDMKHSTGGQEAS